MILRLFATLLLVLGTLSLPHPALALPVKVKSGDHDGFTRLVLDFGRSVDWTMGRTEDGYALHLVETSPGYDLTEAFNLIGKGRLAAIWSDPQSGDLHLGIGCACHAIPFEFRPGIIVIDLKDGPPPAGSAFELAVDGSVAPELSAPPQPRPQRRAEAPAPTVGPEYNWLATAIEPRAKTLDTAKAKPADLPDPSMQPLRRSLLWQLSEGAAKGLVDMVPPKRSERPSTDPLAPVTAHFGATEPANITFDKQPLTAKGEACIPAWKLDLSAWGDDKPIADQMAMHRANLLGEFDKPDPEAMTKAVQFELFIGFGAETRQMMRSFPVVSDDATLFLGLSYLLDGDPDPARTFANFKACDGPAALWALLDDPDVKPGDQVNGEAVKMAFSALPLHLRNTLGPQLIERFLARQESENARAIRDAVLRAPQHDAAQMALSQAQMDMHQGDARAAEASLDPILADPGPQTAEALETLVEARSKQSLPVKPDVVTALEALVQQTPTGAEADRLNRAIILATALAGDFNGAFAKLEGATEIEPDLWRLMSTIGPDEALLAQAVVPQDQSLPALDPAVSIQIADRLMGLGFAADAARWLTMVPDPPKELAAQIAIGQSDPGKAVALLADEPTASAQTIRLAALAALNDNGRLAEIYKESGDTAMQSMAMARAGRWQDLAIAGSDPWQSAAASLQPDLAAAPAGPLDEAQRLADASAKTREAVTTLLGAVPDGASTP